MTLSRQLLAATCVLSRFSSITCSLRRNLLYACTDILTHDAIKHLIHWRAAMICTKWVPVILGSYLSSLSTKSPTIFLYFCAIEDALPFVVKIPFGDCRRILLAFGHRGVRAVDRGFQLTLRECPEDGDDYSSRSGDWSSIRRLATWWQ